MVASTYKEATFFLFLASVALGTFAAGSGGDKIGRKAVIRVSFLGAAYLALFCLIADLFWTDVFSTFVGFIMYSAFSDLVIYAQEAVPGRVGLISGVMFGVSGIGAAALGILADTRGIIWVYEFAHSCRFLEF